MTWDFAEANIFADSTGSNGDCCFEWLKSSRVYCRLLESAGITLPGAMPPVLQLIQRMRVSHRPALLRQHRLR